MKIKVRAFGALAVCLLLVTACADADLATVAQALNDAASGVGILQTAVLSAADQHLISVPVTRTFLTLATRINQAGKEAVAVTRQINALVPADRSNLLQILTPVIAAVANAQTVLIDNPTAQQNIRAALLLIQTALNSAQIALASTGQ